MDTRERLLRELQVKLHELRRIAKDVVQSLKDVAKEFQNHFKNCHIATMAGSCAGVVGGVMAAVGMGMALFTGGASLGLTAAGIAIGSTGGAVTVGTSIVESFLRSESYNKAEKHLKDFEKTRSDILSICDHLIDTLGKEGLEEKFLLLATFLTRLVGGKAGISIADACELIHNTASLIQQGGEPAVKFALESAGAAGRVTSAVVARIAASTSKVIHVAGGVVGIALIPIDIAFLINSVMSVSSNKQSETAKKITEMAEKLLEMSPSEREIDDMINDTIESFLIRL
ncbi:uncharacterized protein LOC127865785 [Dreissena polymorpha]|uniref:Apolipoprotein L3 n=1 Tax=Dreissena polymorpha TaxID=45954 RepID=A0A9D4LLN0_DREPO|nr:uncharacterized protein LOC127865785 [Dreissena polymorpha]KAH3860783.1 hypothetical protein DPMN_023707 [Dreissena polymorpha]